jgi:hypothetical protein
MSASWSIAPGLLQLREPGFRILTHKQLRAEFKRQSGATVVATWEESVGRNEEEFIYALFKTRPDPSWLECRWDGESVLDLIERFESDAYNRLIENVSRTSPYARILPLRDLLKARS